MANKTSVLIADDDKNICELIRLYLEKEGYEIINYASGEDFINDNNFDYDLFILDIMLKGKISMGKPIASTNPAFKLV